MGRLMPYDVLVSLGEGLLSFCNASGLPHTAAYVGACLNEVHRVDVLADVMSGDTLPFSGGGACASSDEEDDDSGDGRGSGGRRRVRGLSSSAVAPAFGKHARIGGGGGGGGGGGSCADAGSSRVRPAALQGPSLRIGDSVVLGPWALLLLCGLGLAAVGAGMVVLLTALRPLALGLNGRGVWGGV
ncbi:hypothetical protein GPECTOR_43g907 [Gonium pectorale]|uniref:Uncharacterized protein n=1 Tax=Gonium pectorale TaxID=33097 RepID=A0A150G9G3_GONPE|nr:hypothetical protein GPECTOR_43g907 [Gonium pectorale]|eukprot:KXZ46471.1 hypothetical protein GPECTOR_43g907 [Gonium pectorale]